MQEFLSSQAPALLLALFLFTVVVILLAGSRLAVIADALADRTGMGEAITGALFLGAATSLPGLVASLTAALANYPQLAVSNAVGGIAAQTAFLGVADISYRKANLEHAAASLSNIMQGGLLVALLAIPLVAFSLPEMSWFAVHPASVLMVIAYCYGVRLSSQARTEPMWRPRRTLETQSEMDEGRRARRGWTRLLAPFVALGLVTAAAGWSLAELGIVAIARLGLEESIVGGLFTAVSSSLPELVTSIAAVRHGAYTLAVGGIIGGNAFDTLFVAVSDVGYREGSVYHAISTDQLFLISLAILMTAVLMMGLIRREKRGLANIGFESVGILALYGGALLVLFL